MDKQNNQKPLEELLYTSTEMFSELLEKFGMEEMAYNSIKKNAKLLSNLNTIERLQIMYLKYSFILFNANTDFQKFISPYFDEYANEVKFEKEKINDVNKCLISMKKTKNARDLTELYKIIIALYNISENRAQYFKHIETQIHAFLYNFSYFNENASLSNETQRDEIINSINNIKVKNMKIKTH